MNSNAPKYTSLELFLKSLSTESLAHWDDIQNALRERKNQLKQELSNIKAKEKELEKAEAKAKKDQEKAEAKAKKDQEKAEAKAKKEQEKAKAKELAKAKKDQEKAEAKAKKDQEKAEAKAKKEQEKAEGKSNKEVKTINTSSFKNFTIWTSGIKGQDNASQGAPTQEELDSYGGRREWKKTKWAELTKDQKDDPAAPWNCC